MVYVPGVLVLVAFVALLVWHSRRQNTATDRTIRQEAKPRNPVSPHGLRYAIGVGSGNPDPLPESIDHCSVINASKNEIDYECGHHGAKTYQLNMWGLESKKFQQKERCPTCWLERFRKYSIRCVFCGLPIFPGDAVAMYHEDNQGLRREIGTKVEDSFLGCMRWNCCPSAGFYGGHWTEEGFRPAFQDGLTGAELAFKTGKTVVGNM